MFRLIVEPENPKKIVLEEYKGYLLALDSLRRFEQGKEALKDFADVTQAVAQLKAKIKSYRTELRVAKLKYTLSYSPKKAWKKWIPEIQHSFTKDVFQSPSIAKNVKHAHYHKFATTKKLAVGLLMKDATMGIRHKIQDKKNQLRQLRVHPPIRTIQSKTGYPLNYQTCGGVIYKKKVSLPRGESPKRNIAKGMGVFMRYLKSKDKEKVFQEKKPTTTVDNYVGVEIEFGCDLSDQDLAFKLLEADVHNNVFLKRDGSVHVGPYNHELCVLAKEKEIFAVIDKVCDALAESNAKVNKTCGLHVHVDMRNRSPEMVFNNFVCSQNILYAMNPYARAAGTYSRKVETKDFVSGSKIGHYAGVNASAHIKHKTIEIRIHSGTVNKKKINNWIKLLLIIANKKDATKKASATLKEFVLKHGIDKPLADYMHERMNKFMGEKNQNVTEDGAA